jgi:prepilin peptidase CpaA
MASLNDIATRTISNRLLILLGIAGAAVHVVDGDLIGSLIAATFVFLAAAWCWRRGWMGGGDVKLLGAAALGVAPESVLSFIMAVAISGGLLAILYLVARPLLGPSIPTRPKSLLARLVRAERWRIRRGGPLPYACAIAAGLLFVIV